MFQEAPVCLVDLHSVSLINQMANQMINRAIQSRIHLHRRLCMRSDVSKQSFVHGCCRPCMLLNVMHWCVPCTVCQEALSSGSTGEQEGSMPQVPWGVGKIMQVMILWLLAYILIGQVCARFLENKHTESIFLRT